MLYEQEQGCILQKKNINVARKLSAFHHCWPLWRYVLGQVALLATNQICLNIKL